MPTPVAFPIKTIVKTDPICKYLEWDSNFFGFRIGRALVDRLKPDSIVEIYKECEEMQISCLYFLANAYDAATMRLAEQHAFRFVDIRVTLERPLKDNLPQPGPVPIRLHRMEDIPALRSIASYSFIDSRFYYDDRFPRSRCNALYETWIENSCHGFEDVVLVAELDGQPCGFLTCKLLDEHVGELGLMGVIPEYKGRGIGQSLVNQAFHWFAGSAVDRAQVATQGRNLPAQRLFQRSGFLTREIQLWYHKWFDTD